jgi:hypothetical protein
MAAKTTGLLAAAVLAGLASGGTAWAGGNGAQSQTLNAHGTAVFGLDELDLNPNSASPPPPGISLPVGCWLSQDEGIISTNGNAILHDITNKTGEWFTTTYTGQAAVFPLIEINGVPVVDPTTGDDEVDSSGTPIATGHLTQWFGNEDNNKNQVSHATVHFDGTDASGNPVSLFGHFQATFNAAGQPTATSATFTC